LAKRNRVNADLAHYLLKLEERHSYNFDYTSFLRVGENGCIYMIPLVGAGRFERPTPCAQGSFRRIPAMPCFLVLSFKADAGILLKFVEPC